MCRTLHIGSTRVSAVEADIDIRFVLNPCQELLYLNVLEYQPWKIYSKITDFYGRDVKVKTFFRTVMI
ncbi:MAG: hypothetical protein IPQ10_10275 [Saprospiraceae bacterium]|nr:hypothetical protein [Saprospiraceae bacterium]MBK7794759.1 hypothetical protein [Saprospiraceae bacterium]MBK8153198.1 hypothetical protein [Saprospiraceae bacterium]MBK9377168.1 hypothetical protein [Saprospiraceae bacterium]MBL0261427.1 hypothetical protein [Saprospiraceae bacterium]